MEIRHIMHTARSVTIEIADGGRYFTKQPIELRLNGEPTLTTEKTITSLFDLKPDQKYVVEAYVNGEKQGEVSFKTDYEYVTLDVTRFGAKGDGEHDDTHFIQAAIMACPVNSRVYFPAGTYRITSLFLKAISVSNWQRVRSLRHLPTERNSPHSPACYKAMMRPTSTISAPGRGIPYLCSPASSAVSVQKTW